MHNISITLRNLRKKLNYLEGSIAELVDGATGVPNMCCIVDCKEFGDTERGEIECADDDGDDILRCCCWCAAPL